MDAVLYPLVLFSASFSPVTRSSSYHDELVYAAAMLYKTTGDNVYLQDALNKYNQFGYNNQVSWAFDWSDKLMAAKVGSR